MRKILYNKKNLRLSLDSTSSYLILRNNFIPPLLLVFLLSLYLSLFLVIFFCVSLLLILRWYFSYSPCSLAALSFSFYSLSLGLSVLDSKCYLPILCFPTALPFRSDSWCLAIRAKGTRFSPSNPLPPLTFAFFLLFISLRASLLAPYPPLRVFSRE